MSSAAIPRRRTARDASSAARASVAERVAEEGFGSAPVRGGSGDSATTLVARAPGEQAAAAIRARPEEGPAVASVEARSDDRVEIAAPGVPTDERDFAA